MEVEIKKAVKAGNSSAVILPRAWLDKEVRVELVKKTYETILLDTIDIARKYINLNEIIGIYLAGSYARKEEGRESDIDILIISESIDREIIKEGAYNILIVSKALVRQKLENDLFPIGSMIKEAVPLLNSYYLKSLEVKVTRKNVKWYMETTGKKLELIKKALDKTGKNADNRVVYTLILRIRTLYIIEKIFKNKPYLKKDFLKIIKKLSGNAYSSYLAVKNNSKSEETTKQEAENLYNYLEKQLDKVKKELS
jgi:predicted nucleotidyltransferase